MPFHDWYKRCLLVSISSRHHVYKEARPVLNTRWVPPSFRPVRPVFRCHNITALITHSLDPLVWSDEQEAGSEQEGSGFESPAAWAFGWGVSMFSTYLQRFLPGTLAASHSPDMSVRLPGKFKLATMTMHWLCKPVQGVSRLSPYDSRDKLQQPYDPQLDQQQEHEWMPG